MRTPTYRENPKPRCTVHNQIQAASWSRGIRGLWYQHCIMCGAEAPWWKWMLVPFTGILDDLPTGPGPVNTFDPRLSDEELRRYGVPEARIKSRIRHLMWSPNWVQRHAKMIDRLEEFARLEREVPGDPPMG